MTRRLATLLAATAALAAVATAEPRHRQQDDDTLDWLRDPSSPVSVDDLSFLLEHAAAMESDDGRIPALNGALNVDDEEEETEGEEEAGPKYPELNAAHRSFAVNPSFDSFYVPSLKEVEEAVIRGVVDKPKQQPQEEVAVDPFQSTDSELRFPKKASLHNRANGVSADQVDKERMEDLYFTAMVAVGSALAVFAVVGAGVCYHRVRRNSKASEDVEYPAYGVTGPGGKESSPTSGADRKLAQNAQMYHYQHQKQQMIAFDSANGGGGGGAANGRRGSGGAASDVESDCEGEEGDYTVYECPGLAPAGEMEVHNPLFQDETTPKAK